MQTKGYATGRVMLFAFGWTWAAILAYSIDLLMAGAVWPIFGTFAAWWTYLCALYINAEEQRERLMTPRGDVASRR